MNRKISVGMAVTIVILAMTVTFSITMLIAMRLFDSTVSSVKEKESMYNKVAEVDRYVRSNDYYPIDETVLYDRLTAGYLLGTGDKYARYYSAIAYTELMNQQSGKVMGIGVELGIDQTGYAKVTKVYEDSPAQEAGIVAGDYITAIDGTEVKSLSGGRCAGPPAGRGRYDRQCDMAQQRSGLQNGRPDPLWLYQHHRGLSDAGQRGLHQDPPVRRQHAQ